MVTISKGADGTIEPFSKQYDDPAIAMRTQFSLAEAYLEMAKRHRKLDETEAAALEYASAKQLLSKAMDQFTDPRDPRPRRVSAWQPDDGGGGRDRGPGPEGNPLPRGAFALPQRHRQLPADALRVEGAISDRDGLRGARGAGHRRAGICEAGLQVSGLRVSRRSRWPGSAAIS